MRGRALGIVFVAACGRIGFDATGGAGAPADAPPGATPVVPLTLPAGGHIDSVAIAPDGAWYAVSARAGVHRSDDHERWVPCGQADAPQHVSVGADGVVYLVAFSQIVRSTDRCETFTAIAQPAGFAVSVGHRGGEVFATTTAGLTRWTGATWAAIPTPLMGDTVLTFAGLPGGASVVGSTFGGLAVSPDAATWTQVTTGLATTYVTEVAVTPTRMYAITGADLSGTGGISCADGTGAAWAVCAPFGGQALAVDPLSPLHVVAVPYDNLIETRDGFATTAVDILADVGLDAANVHDLVFTPDGGLVLASSRGVAYAPPAPTLAFTPRNEGLAAWVINDVARVGADVYLATDAGVLHATAGDAAFTTSTTGIAFSSRAYAVAGAPAGDVIAVGRSVWASSDRGASWRVLAQMGAVDLYEARAVAFQGARLVIASRYRIGVADPPYTSFAYTALGGPDVHDVYADADAIWVATSDGVQVSRDGGASFTGTAITTNTHALAALADGALVALTTEGVRISDAARTAWATTASTGATAPTTVTVDGTTLVVAGGGSALVTRDRGATWRPVAGTSTLAATALHVDGGDGSLVIATAGRGLVRVRLD